MRVQSTMAFISSHMLKTSGRDPKRAAVMSTKLWRTNATFRQEWQVGLLGWAWGNG